ncbi:TPA: hypothetical protein DDW35_09680 [Candidatus Sumerlaeota bacterium]|jgi:hypothetical protein|nr:hypothetical protein [Candidatus Sumerlaeota bacterium]
MRKCPVCQFCNMDSRDTCLKCGTALTVKPGTLREPRRIPGANLYWKLNAQLMKSLRQFRRALSVPLPQYVPHRFPFVAAFLALLPGLGQVYNHQPKKIIWFVPPFVLFLGLAIHYITTPYWGNTWIVCTFGVMMFSFSDALLAAAEINGQTFTFRNRLAALTYPIFLLGAFSFLCSLMACMHWPVFTQFHVRQDYMAPVLRSGDDVCDEGITYLFRNPRPGDVVRYDPPPYQVEVRKANGNDIYVVDPQNAWERVLAVGGETLERRSGAYYVDGKKLSKAYYPLVTDPGIFQSFKITCPAGKYLILISNLPEDNMPLIGGGKVPDFNSPNVTVTGWESACCVGKSRPVLGGWASVPVIFTRAWFIYSPSERRRFFQAEGPRFEQENH